jgi:hypothetical protein
MNSQNKTKRTKQALKSLIKECVREMLLEEGLLSNVVSEVVSGMNAPPLLESAPSKPAVDNTRKRQARKQQLQETRKKMMDAIGGDAYGGVNLFEGTEPLRSGGTPGAPSAPSSPLAGFEPGDKGVDITKLLPGMSDVWKKLM